MTELTGPGLCPLFTIAATLTAKRGSYDIRTEECITTKCALWNEPGQGCGLVIPAGMVFTPAEEATPEDTVVRVNMMGGQ